MQEKNFYFYCVKEWMTSSGSLQDYETLRVKYYDSIGPSFKDCIINNNIFF